MNTAMLKARWQALRPREQAMVAAAVLVAGVALVWLVAFAPALSTLRSAEEQRRALDAQLQHMRSLQLLEQSVSQRLGTTARMVIAGERANITLTGTAPDALAQWLTQVRVNARALPSEARLTRNAVGLWDGTLVLTLPPR